MARRRLKKRWLRIIEACHRRRLDEAYKTDAQLRADLEREAALGDEHFGAALLTTEMLEHFKVSIRQPVKAGAQPVVIVPGALVSSLDDVKSGRWMWLNAANLVNGGICDLEIAPYDGSEQDANPKVQIEPAGAFWFLYDTLNVALNSSGFASQVHAYDWRKSVDHESSAQCLKQLILRLHRDSGRPVHLVAHSLGGLVARRAVQCLCKELGMATAKQTVGSLVLLGPAVSGTLAAALGLAGAFRELPFLKLLPPSNGHVQPTTKTWTALYQLLPWNPAIVSSLGDKPHDVRRPEFWRCPIDPTRFKLAFPAAGTGWAAQIDTQCFRKSTAVILGYHPLCPTASEVHWAGKKLKAGHRADMPGDGFMLHACSVLPDTNAYLACGVDHIRLPTAPRVINAVIRILNGEANVGLPEYRHNEIPSSEPKEVMS